MKKFLFAVLIPASIAFTACTDSSPNTTYVTLTQGCDSYEINKGGTYVFSGELYNEKIEVDTKKDVRIILSGLSIENDEEAIEIDNAKNVEIIVEKGTKNHLSGGGDAAINSKVPISFHSEGELYITGTEKHAIECDGNITINGGSYEIAGYEHGIKSEAVITVQGGNINIYAQTGKGIKAEKEYIGENGNVTIYAPENEGLESKGALTINGGTYDITSGDDGINAGTSDSTSSEDESGNNTNDIDRPDPNKGFDPPEGFESERPLPPEGFNPTEGFTPPDGFEGEFRPDRMPINEGGIPPADFVIPEGATTSGRGVPFSHEGNGSFGKINKDSIITINGGVIKINTDCDGIDSNGALTINGGTIIIDGPQSKDDGALDCDGKMIIDGATVATASSRGMLQFPRTMNQGLMVVYFETPLNEGDIISVCDSQGNEIYSHNIRKYCEAFVFTNPEIKNDTEYTIFVNGEEYSKVMGTYGFNRGFGGLGRPDKNTPDSSQKNNEIQNI